MSIILATIHTENYKQLSQKTWDQNKVLYAKKHGYDVIAKDSNFYGIQMGFEKIAFLLDILEEYKDCKLVMWSGTDSLITNFNAKLGDSIDHFDDYHIMVSSDFNFIINSDIMLIRNTDETKIWLKYILDQYEHYKDHQFAEQQAMIDSYEKFRNILLIKPQRILNSYDYSLYQGPPWNYQEHIDVNGNDGQWQEGDFIIHCPGTQMHERLVLADKYMNYVIGRK